MIRRLARFVSFGDQYLFASFVYLGLTLLLWATSPDPALHAQDPPPPGCTHLYEWVDEMGHHSEQRPGCDPESGTICCEATGECIPVE